MASKKGELEEIMETAVVPVGPGNAVEPIVDLMVAMQEALMESDKEDYEGYARTDEPIVYAKLRQKDLKNDTGAVMVPAGGICFGSTKGPLEADVQKVMGIIIGLFEARVRFEKSTDAQPKCGSRDLLQAEDYGYKDSIGGGPRECGGCEFNRESPNFNGIKDGHCKRNYQFLFYDLNRREPICLQVTPGGRKPWREFSAQVKRVMRNAHFKMVKDGTPPPDEVPWITWIVTITPTFVNEQGGYYVPGFEVSGRLPADMLDKIRGVRRENKLIVGSIQKRVAEGANMSGEDLLGVKEAEVVG